MTTHYQAIDSFRLAMINALGCAPSHIDTSGKIERFSTSGKSGDKTAWCQLWLYQAIPFGRFGDHRTGMEQDWRSTAPRERLSHEEYAAQQRQWQAERAENLRKEKAAREAKTAAQRAVWASGLPANAGHGYLAKKRVGAYGLRHYAGANSWYQGALLMPLRDIEGVLQGLQYIFPEPRLINGSMTDKVMQGTKSGCFHHIGKVTNQNEIIFICEGYATGASIYEASDCPVVIAVDAGNLEKVGQLIRHKYPLARIIFCADNDIREEGSALPNTGLEAARRAAIAVRGEVLSPKTTKKADYNDILSAQGVEA
ncbi:MAG: toprim domain-containing protein [Thiolinea sp.]